MLLYHSIISKIIFFVTSLINVFFFLLYTHTHTLLLPVILLNHFESYKVSKNKYCEIQQPWCEINSNRISFTLCLKFGMRILHLLEGKMGRSQTIYLLITSYWYYLLGKETHESWFSSEFEFTCACEKHCSLCEP